MADKKKSFVAYSDWYGTFKALPDDVAGKLIKHVFSYVNDENPKSDDFIVNALFEQIKSTLIRDKEKWDGQRDQRVQAGLKSAEIRAGKSNERSTKSNERSNSLNETERNSTVNGNVSVSDNVSVKENKSIFVAPLLSDVELYFKENGFNAQYAKHVFDYYALNDWKDASGKKVKSWKQKMKGVWLSEEKRKPNNQINQPTSTIQERFFKNGIEMIRTSDGGAVSVIEFNKMFG